MNNKLNETIVILDEDGVTIINSISNKTFQSYKLLDNNQMVIEERSGCKTKFYINPHNNHALRAVQKWSS